jgi:CRP/FNR family transcriptional regulator
MARAELLRQQSTHLVLAELKAACANCNVREICQPAGLTPAELDQIDELVNVRRKLKRGDTLYRASESFDALYAVRSGFFKTRVTYEDGRDQVTGFSMAGEILGMDGIGHGVHHCDAVALEDSEVCAIPYARLEDLSREISSLQRHFHQLMSREIVRESGVMINMSQRLNARGYSPLEFHLRMTREEIGSYLGLKLETVSRAFSRFHKDGLIEVEQKFVRIKNIDGLKQIYAHHVS